MWILLFSEVTLVNYNVSTILSPVVDAAYFKVTLSVSALGYGKYFVSKGHYNIQTYLPFPV